MIDIGTIADLHEWQHELHAYCCRCDRWRVLDLGLMVRAGQGAKRLPLRVRCRECGEVGQLQVRPPMPARSSTGWIAPPASQ
jgi:RNase P subunit RPR2